MKKTDVQLLEIIRKTRMEMNKGKIKGMPLLGNYNVYTGINHQYRG